MESSPHNQSGTPTEDIFAAAVERLEAGESLEEVLNSFSSEAEWLGPLIELTAETHNLQETIAVPSSEASLNNFLLAAESLTLESSDGSKAGLLSRLVRNIGGHPVTRAFVILILILIVLVWGLRTFGLPALAPLTQPTTTVSPVQTTTLTVTVGPTVTLAQTSLPVVVTTDMLAITPSPTSTSIATPTTQFVETADEAGDSIRSVEAITETRISPPLTEITATIEATSVLSVTAEETQTGVTQPVEATPETEPAPEDDNPPQFLPTTGIWRDELWRQIEIGFVFFLLGLGIKFGFRLIR